MRSVKSQPGGKVQKGYTLIELMIVLTMVAILASIAVPQYFDYVRDSRRSDAVSSMNRMMAQQELFYANNNSTYTTTVGDLGYDDFGGAAIAESEEGFYRITMAACGGGVADCVSLAATPVAGSSQAKDSDCFTITLNSRGRQTAATQGGANNHDECWN